MKTLILAIAGSALLSSSALATTVLYRSDENIGTDDMAGALSTLGYTVTTTVGGIGGFSLSDYDIVIYSNQSGAMQAGDLAALDAHVSSGGKLIFNNWRYFLDEAPSLGGAFTGGANQAEVSVGALFGSGVANPITLSSPGWTTFTTSLVATTASVEATFGDGTAAILLGNSGMTIWNGFTYDTGVGQQLFINELNYLASAVGGGGAVPEPASWAMMIAGFGLVGAGLRRRPARAVTA